jgi:hypothetical protein
MDDVSQFRVDTDAETFLQFVGQHLVNDPTVSWLCWKGDYALNVTSNARVVLDRPALPAGSGREPVIAFFCETLRANQIMVTAECYVDYFEPVFHDLLETISEWYPESGLVQGADPNATQYGRRIPSQVPTVERMDFWIESYIGCCKNKGKSVRQVSQEEFAECQDISRRKLQRDLKADGIAWPQLQRRARLAMTQVGPS